MKKIKQCASAITVLLTAAAMLWSCAVASERDSRQELIKGLEKKYGESFTLIGDAGGGNLSADHCAVYVRAERFPDERIYVVHGVFDGKTGDRDNFMAYCLRDEAAAYLTDIADDVYGECRTFYVPDDTGVLPADIGKDSAVGDMLRGGKFYWYLLLPEGQDLSKKDEQLDELMASYDSKVNDLLEYSKRGSLGSSESAYGIKFVNEWKTDIDSIISQIRLSEIKMADMLLSCDYDTTLFLKSLKNTNTAELKKYQKSVIKSYKSSRFNAPSIICMILVIAGLVLSYYFFKTIKRDTSIEVHIIGSILLGSWALGFYHIYHFKMFYGEINESLFLIKETWFFIIFPPIWAIICIRGLISVMCCTIFGFFTGPIYMVLDPLRFLLGKQCISQNQ